jgi:hypothetical protein
MDDLNGDANAGKTALLLRGGASERWGRLSVEDRGLLYMVRTAGPTSLPDP